MFGTTLHLYTVMRAPGNAGEDARIQLIEEGFSPWGFVLAYLLAAPAMGAMAEKGLVSVAVAGVLALGAALLIGLCGRDWRLAYLKHRGWQMVDVVSAINRGFAEQRYFDRQTPVSEAGEGNG